MKQTKYSVELTVIGHDINSVVKTYRDITGLGLKEAKDKVYSAPCVILETTSQGDAESYKTALEACGATVNIFSSITEISAEEAKKYKKLKKIGIGFILLNVFAVFVPAALLAAVCHILEMDFLSMFFFFSFVFAFVWLWANIPGNLHYTDRMVAKTVKKNAEKYNFDKAYTFYSRNATIMIDVLGGRVAYISNLNPWKFQVISAKEIADIKADRTKDLFSDTTTRYVYFQFSYQDKIIKIPTFTSRSYCSLTRDKVQEGLKNAEKYALILKDAKQVANCKDTQL